MLPVKENVENMQIKELICFPESNVLLGVRAAGFRFVLVHLTGHPWAYGWKLPFVTILLSLLEFVAADPFEALDVIQFVAMAAVPVTEPCWPSASNIGETKTC